MRNAGLEEAQLESRLLEEISTASDMQIIPSCKMLGWIKHKLKSRLPGEISISSDMHMTPPLRQIAKNN